MCQAKFHGHAGGHHHHHGVSPEAPAAVRRSPAGEPTSRREALRRLKAAGLLLAAGGSHWGSPVRVLADDGHPPAAGRDAARLFDLKEVAEGIYAAIAR